LQRIKIIHAVPLVVRIKVGITVEKLARFELAKRRKVLTALSALTAMSAMFLFPFLAARVALANRSTSSAASLRLLPG
jgi:ABC-type anion transport system duplicated permease subunit